MLGLTVSHKKLPRTDISLVFDKCGVVSNCQGMKATENHNLFVIGQTNLSRL